MSDARAKIQLDALYAELPNVECKQECAESCGPIDMSRIEWQRIQKRLGFTPKAVSLTCPMLEQGLCSVYTVRPMICRLWAVVETMRCPWGCVADRYLTHEEGLVFLARAGEIGTPEEAAHWREIRRQLEERTPTANLILGALQKDSYTTWQP